LPVQRMFIASPSYLRYWHNMHFSLPLTENLLFRTIRPHHVSLLLLHHNHICLSSAPNSESTQFGGESFEKHSEDNPHRHTLLRNPHHTRICMS